ncbi:MAG: hypothetical protein WC843_05095 [Candidatus Gracilibacteria bacterium]|jgi:hypothetical protein
MKSVIDKSHTPANDVSKVVDLKSELRLLKAMDVALDHAEDIDEIRLIEEYFKNRLNVILNSDFEKSERTYRIFERLARNAARAINLNGKRSTHLSIVK